MQDSPFALVDSGLLKDHIVTKVHCLEVGKQKFDPQEAGSSHPERNAACDKEG